MITLIILLAAGLHAGWNALLRAGTDKLWSMTVMCIAIALVCGGLALVLPMPARVELGIGDPLGVPPCRLQPLSRADLSQRRSRADLFHCAGLLAAAGDARRPPSSPVSCPIQSPCRRSFWCPAASSRFLRDGGSKPTQPFLTPWGPDPSSPPTASPTASASGLSGAALRDIRYWIHAVGRMMPPIYAIARDWRSLIRGPREMWVAAGGGIASLVAYGAIIFAMSAWTDGAQCRLSAKPAWCSPR